MPMYEYMCMDCGERFEALRTTSERDESIACPECEKENNLRVPSVVSGVSLKADSGGSGCAPSGSGFG